MIASLSVQVAGQVVALILGATASSTVVFTLNVAALAGPANANNTKLAKTAQRDAVLLKDILQRVPCPSRKSPGFTQPFPNPHHQHSPRTSKMRPGMI